MLESVDYKAVSKAIIVTIAKKMAEHEELSDEDLSKIYKAVEEITPGYCKIAIPVITEAYAAAFTEEELGQLLEFYGEGTIFYKFLTDVSKLEEWISKIDSTVLTTDPFSLVTLLPKEVKESVKEYIFSDLRARESAVMTGATTKITKELKGSDLEKKISEIFA